MHPQLSSFSVAVFPNLCEGKKKKEVTIRFILFQPYSGRLDMLESRLLSNRRAVCNGERTTVAQIDRISVETPQPFGSELSPCSPHFLTPISTPRGSSKRWFDSRSLGRIRVVNKLEGVSAQRREGLFSCLGQHGGTVSNAALVRLT